MPQPVFLNASTKANDLILKRDEDKTHSPDPDQKEVNLDQRVVDGFDHTLWLNRVEI